MSILIKEVLLPLYEPVVATSPIRPLLDIVTVNL